MGDFYVFDAEMDKLKGKDVSIKEYYSSIIQNAFPGLFLENKPDLTDYEIEGEPAILNEYSLIPTFYIKSDRHKARDEQSVRVRIAEEENKYYYGWRENELEDIQAEDGSVILEKLTRVNALIYHNIVFKLGNQRTTYDNHWNAQIGPQPTVPILIFTYAWAKDSGTDPARYFVVCLNENALPFFLDTDEEKNFYQYQKQQQVYRSVATQQPGTIKGVLEENKLVYDKEWRTVHGYYKYRQTLVNKKKAGVDGIIKERKLPSVLTKFPTDTEKAKSQFLNNLTVTQKKAAQEFADNYAKLLPPSFKCFYYRDNTGELQGFLSSVNTGEGRRGNGGYAMRADKVSEVNYLWKFNANIDPAEQPIAILLSHLIGLEYTKKLDNYAGISAAYFPTNWPVTGEVSNKSTPVQINNNSWLFYIKNFEGDDQKRRRNKPPDPAPPRISGAQYPAYTHKKFDHKGNGPELNNRSYRIWKKGDAFAGVLLRDGTTVKRDSAGSVMALALSDFEFYEPAGFPKSSLSATKFVQYLVMEDNDPTANEQWVKDNPPKVVAKLTTDQEWCHLLGHGDGGPEELGNFVAGSKHCNTEQLAIEVGLRRITHNDDLPEKIRKNFTAKITAYLLPNRGAWVEQQYTLDELKSKVEIPKTQEIKVLFEKWLPKFFVQEQNSGLYKLNIDNVAESFQSLSDELKKSVNSDRKSLFQFRQNLEKNFFLYLPVGRWMRYKIFYMGNKIFDHIYDAQSQSFNQHEAQILDYTVERVLYQALGKYEKNFQLKIGDKVETLSYLKYHLIKIDERVVDLVPNEQQIKILTTGKEFYETGQFFLLVSGSSDEFLVTKAKELLKDMNSKPKTEVFESAKANKVITDFKSDFEEVATKIDEAGTVSDELKQELEKAVENAASLAKEIIAQLELAGIYEAFQKTLNTTT